MQTTPTTINHHANVHPYTHAATLPDIAQLQVNSALPVQERIQRFIADVGNPYLFRVGDTVVHVQYGVQPTTLQERLTFLASK